MGADVKIGLLFGLIFVFIAAFVFRGVPHSNDTKDNHEPTTVFVGDRHGIRPEILPETFPPNPISERPPMNTYLRAEEIEQVPSLLTEATWPEEFDRATEFLESAIYGTFYIVQKGDTLADIAKRFYGPEEGNRRVNVMRIFEANRRLLDSPDEIYVGQELVIPPLRASQKGTKRLDGVFPDSMFEEVESVGKRHL